MIHRYLQYIEKERRYSPHTVAAYGDDLTHFCTFLGLSSVDDFRPNDYDESDVKQWILYMLETEKNSPRSVKRRLAALHGLYRYLLRMGLVPKDITLRVQTPKADKPLPVFFRPGEITAALSSRGSENDSDNENGDATDNQDDEASLVIDLLYQTGMRRAELARLRVSDIRFSESEIRVFGKRSKERIIPLGPQLLQDLQNHVSSHSLSPDSSLFGLSERQVYALVSRRMGEVSTLKKHSPHVLRHTFATAMLNNGADIRTIQTLLGHASIATTQIYTHTTFDQVRQAYSAAHPRAKKKGETDGCE